MAAKQKLTPAELVVVRFGGVRRLGRLLKQDPSSISKWIERGGRIPDTNRCHKDGTHRKLLELAKTMGITLTSDELTYGGKA